MYAYIVLGLILAALAGDLLAGAPPPEPVSVFVSTGIVTVLVMLAGLAISGYILARQHRIVADEKRFLRTVGLLGRFYRTFVAAALAVILYGCGWGALAVAWAGGTPWEVPVLAINLAPLVLLLVVAWTALYWADRRLRTLMFARAGAAISGGRWTLPGYLAFMFRQYLLVILVPMLVLLTVMDVAGHTLPEPAAGLVGVVALASAALLAGPWVRVCWRTEPLPEGDLRTRLLDLADRAGVRVADVLVWRTNLSIANGCMIGLAGPLRYILITDALLLTLTADEVEAVFAHEVAHAKYRHALVYVLMTFGVIGLSVAIGEAVVMFTNSFWMGMLTMGLLAVGYLMTVFGYVSRRCEQECDLFAVRATACPAGCSLPDARGRIAQREPGPAAAEGVPVLAAAGMAAVAGFQETAGSSLDAAEEMAATSDETPDTQPAAPVCEHRVQTFVTALRRIARLNGSADTRRGVRHFSIARRCRFLKAVLARPDLAREAERSARRLKVGAVLLGALAIVVSLVVLTGLQLLIGAGGALEPDEPENPTGPDDLTNGQYIWIVRLMDRDEVNPVALRPPKFDRHADAAAPFDDGRVTG